MRKVSNDLADLPHNPFATGQGICSGKLVWDVGLQSRFEKLVRCIGQGSRLGKLVWDVGLESRFEKLVRGIGQENWLGELLRGIG